MTTTKTRSWGMYSGKGHEVAVVELPDGRWLGSMGLKSILDPHGTSTKQEVFATVEAALHYVGYPWEIVGVPEQLK